MIEQNFGRRRNLWGGAREKALVTQTRILHIGIRTDTDLHVHSRIRVAKPQPCTILGIVRISI